ncbi:MAG: hypothetical protein IT379_37250 [Deltaproteobacteria bacterium]|nr:hypothetical protein [Deltaproteobacteria bacterium]
MTEALSFAWQRSWAPWGGLSMDDESERDTPEETRPQAHDADYGAAVIAAREARGWSRERLSVELGVGLSTVARIESLGHVPYARIQRSIRDMLGVESRTASALDAIIDATTRYEDDIACRYVVAHMAPCHLEVIGLLMGVTRERIRQIEAKALRKIAERASAELRGWLADKAERGGVEMHGVQR